MQVLRTLAPAKINLTLEVLGRRDDGYHDLVSVVQTLDFADDLTIAPDPAGGRQLRFQDPDGRPLPTPGDELIARAWQRLVDRSERDLPARVTVRKRLPLAAGLGGGSSDAAAFLRLAARFWDLPLAPADWRTLAAGIGSGRAALPRRRHRPHRGTRRARHPPARCARRLAGPPDDAGAAPARRQVRHHVLGPAPPPLRRRRPQPRPGRPAGGGPAPHERRPLQHLRRRRGGGPAWAWPPPGGVWPAPPGRCRSWPAPDPRSSCWPTKPQPPASRRRPPSCAPAANRRAWSGPLPRQAATRMEPPGASEQQGPG